MSEEADHNETSVRDSLVSLYAKFPENDIVAPDDKRTVSAFLGTVAVSVNLSYLSVLFILPKLVQRKRTRAPFFALACQIGFVVGSSASWYNPYSQNRLDGQLEVLRNVFYGRGVTALLFYTFLSYKSVHRTIDDLLALLGCTCIAFSSAHIKKYNRLIADRVDMRTVTISAEIFGECAVLIVCGFLIWIDTSVKTNVIILGIVVISLEICLIFQCKKVSQSNWIAQLVPSSENIEDRASAPRIEPQQIGNTTAETTEHRQSQNVATEQIVYAESSTSYQSSVVNNFQNVDLYGLHDPAEAGSTSWVNFVRRISYFDSHHNISFSCWAGLVAVFAENLLFPGLLATFAPGMHSGMIWWCWTYLIGSYLVMPATRIPRKALTTIALIIELGGTCISLICLVQPWHARWIMPGLILTALGDGLLHEAGTGKDRMFGRFIGTGLAIFAWNILK